MTFKKNIIGWLFLGFTCVFNVQAQSNDGGQEMRLYGGYNKNNTYENKMIGLEFKPETQPFKFADVLFNAEYHDSDFRGTPSRYYRGQRVDFSSSNSWVNGGLKLRKTFDNGIFVKAGVGVAYVKNRAYGRKITGSHWQFSPTYSLGYNITKSTSIEYQWVHFSNAGTAPPNPGRDFHYITLGYRFK